MAADTERFYITGGTLPSHAPSYILRQADKDLLEGLRAGEFCYVLNTRQIGKSSLMVRTAQQLRAEGHLVALLDLTAIGQNVTPEEWYDGLLTLLAEQVRMRDELEDFWQEHEHLGPLQRFMEAIHRVILLQRPERLFLFVDEIDVVRSLPFSTDEFFTGIRECYNRRVQDATFDRLTFCLLGVATPADLISDTRMSPFNIGRRIVLSDFTLEEVLPLAQGLGPRLSQPAISGLNEISALEDENGRDFDSQAQPLLERVLYWTGGHPYLTQRLCQTLARVAHPVHIRDVDRLCQELFLGQQAQSTDDNLAFVRSCLLRHLPEDAALLDLYRQVRLDRIVRDDTTNPLHAELRLSGIARVVGGELKVRNRIYAQVFNPDWIIANMPGAELRRQRAAYKRGVARSAAVFGSLAILIAALMLLAVVNARHARAAEKRAAHSLYISDINLMQREWEGGNLSHVLELLEETRHSEEKGLEWDYWERQCHQRLYGISLPERITSVTIAPGQDQVIVLGENGLLTQWDLKTGRQVRTMTNKGTACKGVLYSPDGTKLLIGARDTVQLRNAADWRLLHTYKTFNGDINSFAFSPNAAYIGAITDAGCACVWDARTEAMQQKYGPQKGPNPNAFFALGITQGQLELFRADGVMEVHDIQTSRLVRTLTTNIRGGGIAFSPNGARLVGRDHNGNINIMDARTGAALLYLGNDSDLHDVHFSSDERFLFSAQGSAVNVWDARTARLLNTFREHVDTVHSLAATRDNRYLVSGSPDSTVKIWDLARIANPLTLHVGSSPLWHVAYSPDGQSVLTSSEDGKATLLEADTGRKIRVIQASTVRITPAIFSHGGNYIFTGDVKGVGSLWDVKTGLLVRRFIGHHDAINGAVFSPDDSYLYTASDDNTAIQWDVATGKIRRLFRGHSRPVEALALSRNGTRLALGSDDFHVTVWDIASGTLLYTFPTPAEVWGVALSPDGTKMAVSNLRKTIEIWDLTTGKKQPALLGHTNWVLGLNYSPDGKRLATASRDSTAKIWELETGREVLTLKGHKGQVADVAFAPDGRHIATAAKDGDIIIWDTSPLPASGSPGNLPDITCQPNPQ